MSVSLKRMPAGVCDNPECGRFLWWLHAVDMVCFHCQAGRFVHRSQWDFSECSCRHTDPYCGACRGSGVCAKRK